MYRLSNTSQIGLLSRNETAAGAVRYARERLADAASGLEFEPLAHRYSFCGEDIPSVSSIVSHFDPFDVRACAERCSRSSRHELFGRSVEDILAIWEERGRTASEAGTAVHEFCEACFLVKSGRCDAIEGPLRERLGKDGTLLATTPKEEAAARWWDSLDLQRFVLVAKETRLYNPELRYAGTFDLLLYDLQLGHYVQRDYKTNADLFRWYGDRLRAPLSHIKADDVGKYTVQQNLYSIQLKNIDIRVGDMSLVWFKDDASFQEVPLPNLDRLISFAARQYQLSQAA